MAAARAPATVTIPSVDVRNYLRAHGAVAIVVTVSGVAAVRDIGKTRGSVLAAWWCPASEAVRLAQHCKEHHITDPPALLAAAQQLHIVLTPHDQACARAANAINRINAALAQAQENGVLALFNAEYRKRRRAAVAAGRTFPGYTVMRLRLANALFDAAAGKPLASIIAQVFEA